MLAIFLRLFNNDYKEAVHEKKYTFNIHNKTCHYDMPFSYSLNIRCLLPELPAIFEAGNRADDRPDPADH